MKTNWIEGIEKPYRIVCSKGKECEFFQIQRQLRLEFRRVVLKRKLYLVPCDKEEVEEGPVLKLEGERELTIDWEESGPLNVNRLSRVLFILDSGFGEALKNELMEETGRESSR